MLCNVCCLFLRINVCYFLHDLYEIAYPVFILKVLISYWFSNKSWYLIELVGAFESCLDIKKLDNYCFSKNLIKDPCFNLIYDNSTNSISS